MIVIELKDPILEFIWNTKGVTFTVNDVVVHTRLPYTTVVHRVLKYENQGVIIERGRTEETIGRPMNLWSVVIDKFEEVVGKVIE